MKCVLPATAALALLLAGCAAESTVPLGLPDNTRTCPAEPPQACTMDYRPVIGYDRDGGVMGEYANACGGCATEGVAYTSPVPPSDRQTTPEK